MKGAPCERLFYCLLLLVLAAPAAAAGRCSAERYDAEVSVDYVIDGDTVILGDGTHLRLIGVDTPEIDHDHSDGNDTEPGALAARRYLRGLLAGHAGFPLLRGRETRDRYGRLLGHLFLPGGANVQERLLRAGHATPLTIPPNLRFLDCYRAAVEDARREHRGIWALARYRPADVVQLDADTHGYRVVEGEVTRIGHSRSSVWINLGEGFALRVVRGDLQWFPDPDFRRLTGRRVRAAGDVYRRHGQLRMRLRHPADLRVLPSSEGNR